MSWLDAPLPAVPATYRTDGSVFMTPILRRDPRCVRLVFEAVPPFRGIEMRGDAEIVEGDATAVRAEIAGRYLGAGAGSRFAAEPTKPGVLVRLTAEARAGDLSAILPAEK